MLLPKIDGNDQVSGGDGDRSDSRETEVPSNEETDSEYGATISHAKLMEIHRP